MPSGQRFSQVRWSVAAAAAACGVGELVRRRRSGRNPPPPPPPPVTTQSSPGQIADLQQAYGADMAGPTVPPQHAGTEDG
jgi:hypothetical protein